MSKRVTTPPQDIKRTVFVVYGRNIAALTAMYEFLGTLNLKPLEWEQARQLTGEPTPFVGRILEAAFRNAQAVIVILTGDDEARLRDSYLKKDDEVYERELTPQPRQNQVFEAGYAFGKFPKRTIVVQFGQIRSFSDISGRYIPRFTGTAEDRRALINSLKMAECEVDDSGTRWLKAGNFKKALN